MKGSGSRHWLIIILQFDFSSDHLRRFATPASPPPARPTISNKDKKTTRNKVIRIMTRQVFQIVFKYLPPHPSSSPMSKSKLTFVCQSSRTSHRIHPICHRLL